ncbi:MAG: transporter, partial [Gammaproteobacteria bacterium]|nr:transporter [Gammaproteobacteria bacterium]
APVQTANPDFQGGDRVDLGFGLNLAGQKGKWRGARLALEFILPVYQDLNGPQMEADWAVTAGAKYMF